MEIVNIFGPKLGSRLPLFSHETNIFQTCKPSRFPLFPFPTKPAPFFPLKATANTLACEDNDRKFKKVAPSDWGHYFLSVHVDFSEMDELAREIETLKPNVRDMFMSSKSIKKKILFIYLLVSLGIAYHFEDEIEDCLKDGFQNIEEMMVGEDDLYTVSIIFWVFRTYYHNISSDVFMRFKGENGKFKESLTRDAKSILSLYEAANMGTPTDYILDEALSFTSSYLRSLASSGTCKLNLSRLIRTSLDVLPQHKNMEIIVALEYIRFYEEEEDSEKTLLKFAKLNFRFLQLNYIQELKILSKWYKEQDFESKLPPYYRDRFVEMHLTALAFLEPKYSRMRIIMTKLFTFQIILDDTCDRYASLPEVESLANSIERWDPDDHAMDGQPNYLKSVVKFLVGTIEEFNREFGSESEGSYSVKATVEECKRMMRANLQLAKWAKVGHLPSFDDYLEVALIEIAVYNALAGILLGLENICKEEAFEWLKSRDKLSRAISFKARVPNGIFGYEDDMSRGYVTGSVNCYKKQYGVSEEEAFRKLREMVAECNKVMNEEFLKPINVPYEVLKGVITCLRMVNFSYAKDDDFTRPGLFNDYVKSIYVHLI